MNNYDNFFIGVRNLSEARKYYEDILGLKLKFDFSSKGMIAFNVGNEEPAIILKDKNVFKNIKPTIWFEVENVKIEYNKLKKRGVQFLSEPYEIITGLAVEFEDPFGNRLGITTYPYSKCFYIMNS
ncbi:lactoylglutathione lyase [Clostridium beijerinckii]|uniref:Lactoylglutathione lyase n=1 Tax=Clostridium beijerinckii TaxID=1520 RepID=A0A0B5QPB3_CLOBE|nr:VOC family protein [Clostridium beijerinckii]AJG99847.1 lactoylglutathione lyase [Clostridium beijerinckii]NRT71451.1 putative enzyme related to lactoylglutathione lyase [Clostridium beijerinckii]